MSGGKIAFSTDFNYRKVISKGSTTVVVPDGGSTTSLVAVTGTPDFRVYAEWNSYRWQVNGQQPAVVTGRSGDRTFIEGGFLKVYEGHEFSGDKTFTFYWKIYD